MISWLTNIFCPECIPFGTGNLCEDCEDRRDPRNHPYAKAATPDELIIESFIASFAKGFEDWTLENSIPELESNPGRLGRIQDRNRASHHFGFTLKRGRISGKFATPVEVKFRALFIQYRIDPGQNHPGYLYPYCELKETTFTVNGLEMVPELGIKLFKAYSGMKRALDEAKAVAAKAKADMEANEKKWNLAESLLGLTRTPSGALVPKSASLGELEPFQCTNKFVAKGDECKSSVCGCGKRDCDTGGPCLRFLDGLG